MENAEFGCIRRCLNATRSEPHMLNPTLSNRNPLLGRFPFDIRIQNQSRPHQNRWFWLVLHSWCEARRERDTARQREGDEPSRFWKRPCKLGSHPWDVGLHSSAGLWALGSGFGLVCVQALFSSCRQDC